MNPTPIDDENKTLEFLHNARISYIQHKLRENECEKALCMAQALALFADGDKVRASQRLLLAMDFRLIIEKLEDWLDDQQR